MGAGEGTGTLLKTYRNSNFRTGQECITKEGRKGRGKECTSTLCTKIADAFLQ